MTIPEIKSRLSILTVLSHYGLAPNDNGMIKCPFHKDAKASMKVYTDTNTVYCFAGSCRVSHLDVIDFIMQMDGSTKREAILKAKSWVSEAAPVLQVEAEKVEELDVATIYAQSLEAIKTHQGAKTYLASRKVSVEGVGYKTHKTASKWGRGCVLFGLRDRAGEVVSLYGRSIKGKGHYYSANRSGLYPGYPNPKTKKLILTESVIDAATLVGVAGYEVLALYGTNGLTAEHKQTIQELEGLEEIIFALDNDAAGNAATQQLARVLLELRPGVKLSKLALAEGQDVNGVAQGVEDVEGYFSDLLDNRELVELGQVVPERVAVESKLDTSSAHNLIYTTATADYRIAGGIRASEKDLDSLKITLIVTNETGRKSRQKLDLFEDKQIEKCARAIAERLSLRPDLVELDLDRLTDELEQYRETLREDKRPESGAKVAVSEADRGRCLEFLKAPDLLSRINELIERAGIVGEEANRLLLFVVTSSYKMPTTLHALIQGASGSGKTRLLKVVSDLIPEEDVERFTRVTEGALYNFGEYYFQSKLVCFEDLDGLKEEAMLAVRELQSNEVLRSGTSVKDELGNIGGMSRVVRGPIASMACTTKAGIYEDNISRCFVVAVDESREQSLRIIQYQNEKSAGKINGRDEKRVREFLQNALRLLKPLEVVNPFANRIELPKEAHKIRRLNELYQSFVRQVTLLNQYQRKRDERGRLITESEDLRVACEILFESIVLKVDELDGSLRQFFEQLKSYVQKLGKDYAFNRFELRKATGVSKTQQHRYLRRLVELEYLRQEGFANRGYRYKIAHWDDQAALRERIKASLDEQIVGLAEGLRSTEVQVKKQKTA
ncbi:MAG: toprim domain-containing protein [Bacteroidota bacterium]